MLRVLAALFLSAGLAIAAGEVSAGLPDGLYAVVTVPEGVVVAELHYKEAPMTVANYVGLAEGTLGPRKGWPFFDGLTFHRVVEDFVVQGGDPTGTGEGNAGYAFPDEIVPGLRHDRAGVVQMANDGPDTNGSQWCFMLRPVPRLNYLHSVFGHVVRGLDVLPKVKQGDTMTVRIVRIGKDAEAFRVTKASFAAMQAAAKTYTGPREPGPDAPFDDPDGILPTEWSRAKAFNFKLANFQRFTGRRICARILAKTPAGGVDPWLRETAARLGLGERGALAVYCADSGTWSLWIGADDRKRFPEGAAKFLAQAGEQAQAAIADAKKRLPGGQSLAPGQIVKISTDCVLDALIFRLERD